MTDTPAEMPGNQNTKAVLAHYLELCRVAAAECFKHAIPMDGVIDTDYVHTGTRLVRTSIALIAALEGKPESSYRIVVDRSRLAEPEAKTLEGRAGQGGDSPIFSEKQ